MAARGPLSSERRLSCCLTSAPTQTPAPRPQRRLAAPLPAVGTGRGARRRRARAAAGTVAGSPLSAPLRRRGTPGSRRPPAPLRSAPVPVGPAVPRRCCRGCVAASPPPEATHGGRSDVGLFRRSSPGTGKIVDLGPAMPNVLGCEQPKATGSSPTDRRWGHLVQPVG
ncbi:putative hydro-lyase KRH_21160 [Manacus candei]|uniref:putative hydro-lyase KRH_21160 n=1 Tax=Manacus candei TaxID=415023 RepID=UPI0022277B34|nr:putative hydro-lyase KRH_21160 [Manacus candei]XP_051628968.1 putative hydro-lyase KRH_21160 [Manacus candei]